MRPYKCQQDGVGLTYVEARTLVEAYDYFCDSGINPLNMVAVEVVPQAEFDAAIDDMAAIPHVKIKEFPKDPSKGYDKAIVATMSNTLCSLGTNIITKNGIKVEEALGSLTPRLVSAFPEWAVEIELGHNSALSRLGKLFGND